MFDRKHLRLLVSVAVAVAALLAIKLTVRAYRLEFLTLDTLFSSVVAGTIFIIGFLLTGILPDYKEAERIPAEIRTALEAIHDDIVVFAQSEPRTDVAGLRTTLLGLVTSIELGLGNENPNIHIENAVDRTGDLVNHIAEAERFGMVSNYVVRLRGAVDVVRKCLYRIGYIQKIEFLPSVHVLIQTLVAAVLFLLLLLRTDGSFGSALIFSFVSYLFVFALHLITVFEQPFRELVHSADKVSLYQLREFAQTLSRRRAADERASDGVGEPADARI